MNQPCGFSLWHLIAVALVNDLFWALTRYRSALIFLACMLILGIGLAIERTRSLFKRGKNAVK